MRRFAGRLARGAAYTLAACMLLAAAAAAAAWFWLPKLEGYKPQVEHLLSEYLGQQISMTSVSAEWRGFSLNFKASGVRVAVEDHPGSGMRFGEILVAVDPLSVFRERWTFESLELIGPTIEAARLPDGRFRVGDTIIGTPRGTLQRLLRGRNLEITDGTLVWRDARSSAPPLQIDDIHLVIRPRGQARIFDFTASPPPRLMGQLAGSGSYDARSLGPGLWTAALDLSVTRLNLARIPQAIQEQLPWRSQGRVDVDLHAEWSEGALASASADVAARDFVIPYARGKTPLSAKEFSSSVSWRRSAKEWRLVFTEPRITLDEEPVSVSRFELERNGERRTYSARDVNVHDLLGVVNRLDIELPWKDLIDRLHPRGVFSQASLSLTGPYLEATGWRFEGDFRNVGWSAQDSYPGIQGLGGRLVVDDTGGELTLAPASLEVNAVNTLRENVGFERVEGVVKWHRRDGDWIVDVADGIVSNDDLSLSDLDFHLRVHANGAGSPYVQASSRIRRARIDQLHRYLPAKRMSAKHVEWLERALAGGEITGGRFSLDGRLGEFPFEEGGGELQVSARIRDALLDFHEEWPNMESLDGEIELNNSRFEARVERGAFMHSPVQNARVWSGDFFERDRTLHIQGSLQAEADDVIQFLRRGPLNKNPPPPYSTMTATGTGVLTLLIELPFTRLKEASRVRGDYRFEGVAVEVTNGVEIESLAGRVRFTEGTVEGSGLQGDMLGGPVRADVSTVEPGRPMTFAITGSGEADVSRLTPVVGPVLASRLKGRAQWSGRFVGGPGPNRLDVDSELKGVEIRLPDPVGKSGGTVRAIDLHVEFDDDRKHIVLSLDGGLEGELHYDRRDGRPTLVRGVLNLGRDAALPEEEALAVAVEGEYLDMDQWISAINELKELAGREEQDSTKRDALFSHLRTVEIDVERLRYLRRDLGPVRINAGSGDGKRWTARLDGARMQGTGTLVFEPKPARYTFDMTRLHWPQLQDKERVAGYKTPPEPTEFAHLSIKAGDFRYGDMRLGRLDLEAGPEQQAWRIRRLSLQQPELGVEMTGRWSSDRFGAPRTRIEVTAEAGHLGKALAQLGLEDQVANGEAEMAADVNWSGEPGDFRLAALNGDLSFSATDGRFLKVEPGSGRLLGLFNLDTLARRFKLDFTDVFREGLAFDRINGDAEINAGRLRTDGIFIIGPAALMELSGTTDMAAETFDLDVMVAPQWGGNLSLAGAIANPAAGAVIFVIQQLFKKQMAKLIHYKYRVTGGWDDPRVKAVERKAPEPGREIGRN